MAILNNMLKGQLILSNHLWDIQDQKCCASFLRHPVDKLKRCSAQKGHLKKRCKNAQTHTLLTNCKSLHINKFKVPFHWIHIQGFLTVMLSNRAGFRIFLAQILGKLKIPHSKRWGLRKWQESMKIPIPNAYVSFEISQIVLNCLT